MKYFLIITKIQFFSIIRFEFFIKHETLKNENNIKNYDNE